MSIKQTNCEIYRMTISANEILGTIEAMATGIDNEDSRSLIKKFKIQAFKIDMGTANPAYITTGNSTKSKQVTLENLGFTDETQVSNTIGTIFAATSNSGTLSHGMGDTLSSEQENELEALEAQMLRDLQGTGSDNVILEERRKEPRS